MLTLFVLHGDGTVTGEFSIPTLFAALRDPSCTFWLDMLKPTDEEIALLDDVFGFHPLAIEDTISYVQRPKIESYNHIGDAMTTGYFYMVFHGPDLETFRENLRTKELDLFVSARYLVTIHEEEMKSVMTVRNRVTSDPAGILSRGIDVLLHNIIDYMVDHYEPILDYLDEALDDLEEQALHNPQPTVLSEIASKKKQLLNLRRIVGPQREVIAQLTRGEVPFIREATRVYLRDVQDHLIRVVEMIELYRDLVLGSRDIYLSSIGNNTNQVMKTLTIISVIGLPFTIVTGFFGMNFFDDKGLHGHWMFAIAVVSIVASVTGLLIWFRMRKWI